MRARARVSVRARARARVGVGVRVAARRGLSGRGRRGGAAACARYSAVSASSTGPEPRCCRRASRSLRAWLGLG